MTVDERPPTPVRRPPEFPGADAQHDALLRHVVFTGTLWFCAALVGALLPLAGLLADGWRPSALPAAGRVGWWTSSVLVLAAVAALAWAGCPVVATEPATAAARKSVSIRVGLVLLLVGLAGAGLSVLLG